MQIYINFLVAFCFDDTLHMHIVGRWYTIMSTLVYFEPLLLQIHTETGPYNTMDGKLIASLLVLVVVMLTSVDPSEARLCIGSRVHCKDNPVLKARGVTCSTRRRGHVCRGYGWNGCRCLPDLYGRMLASEGNPFHSRH